jgi:hypothetical protein
VVEMEHCHAERYEPTIGQIQEMMFLDYGVSTDLLFFYCPQCNIIVALDRKYKHFPLDSKAQKFLRKRFKDRIDYTTRW